MKLEDSKKIVNYLDYFLDMFNLHTKISGNDLLKKIVIEKGLPVYDECENIIGLISLSNGKFFIFVFKDNYNLKVNINIDSKKSVIFDYNLDSKENIHDSIKASAVMFEANNKSIVMNNVMDIIYNERKYRCKFNTIRNRFKISDIYDYNNVSYSNNEFSHSYRDDEISIENIFGNITYSNTSSNKDKQNIYGQEKISYDNKEYDIITYEFNKLLKQIDPNYFELIDKVKNAVNYFEPNLFEKAAVKSIKTDLSVLENMLGIKPSENEKGHISF